MLCLSSCIAAKLKQNSFYKLLKEKGGGLAPSSLTATNLLLAALFIFSVKV
jgi:hypothetical protein